MEQVPVVKLKRGLSKIKKDITSKVGAVWKLRKPQVITKLKSLKYTYDDNSKSLRTNSMIRKTANVKL